MQPALFRQQAVDFQRQSNLWGAPIGLQPVSWSILAWAAVVSLVLMGVFVCMAPYSRKETVVGYLRPIGGTSKVFAGRAGVVQQVFVKQGQAVKQGDPLMSVVIDRVAADGRNIQRDIIASLETQRAGLQRQIAADREQMASEQHRLSAAINSMHDEMVTVEARRASQSDRIRLSQQLVQEATTLHQRGYLSNLEYMRREADVLEQAQSLNSLIQQGVKQRTELDALESQLAQLPATVGDKIQGLESQLAETEQHIAQAEGDQGYTVRASLDGEVAFSAASIGQAVDPKRVQMEILPSGAALQAELFIPSRAIGFVTAGKTVRLLYDAFPYQAFGTYNGKLVSISQTMLTGAEPKGPLSLDYPAYTAVATLDRATIDAKGRAVPLQPDMTLKADIILDRRPLIRLLLDPLLGTRW